MHTPPPTRGSSKRRSQRAEPAVFGTPSSMTVRRLHQSGQQQQTTSMNNPPLTCEALPGTQHQPGFIQPPFHFQPSSGQQIPDHQPSMVFAQPQPLNNPANTCAWTGGLDDPFAASWHQPVASNVVDQPFNPPVSRLGRPVSQPSRLPAVETASDRRYAPRQYGDRLSPEKMNASSASVDPNLIYSSPSRPGTSESMRSNPFPRPTSSASASRIPYQHILKDPRQELENTRSSRYRPPPPPPQNFAAPHAQALQPRPELQRSNTISSFKPGTTHAASEFMQSSLTRSNSAVNLPRRSSPLKRERTSRASLSSISETPKPIMRTSVVLEVDANGRAGTRVVEASPTKHTKDRYPISWDESDSDSESTHSRSTTQWPSRRSSLAQPRGDERHAKVAKLDPPLEDMENLHLPRSNSSASLRTPSKAAYVAAAQLRRQSSVKKQSRPSMHSRRNTLASLNSSFESLPSVDLNTNQRPEQQSDAGAALRQMMANRTLANMDIQVRPDPIAPTSARKPQLVAREPPCRVQQKSQSFSALPQQNHSFCQAPAFPVDCAPMQPAVDPSPAQTINYVPAPMFRCICSLPLDDGRGALQCGFCAMYLHAACLGMDPLRLPTTYICNFCTNAVSPLGPGPTQNYADWGIAGI